MADTLDITLTDSFWTQVAFQGRGFITNASTSDVYYRENATEPTAEQQGHVLRPEDFVTFEIITGGQKIWARTKIGEGTLIVTPEETV